MNTEIVQINNQEIEVLEISSPGLPGNPGAAGTTDYNQLQNVPSAFPPSAHAHAATDVTQDAAHRFATDVEKAAWNAKQTALLFTPENSTNKNVNNGYAGLDGGGKVPAALLPSFVDDVLEFANLAAFPATGETGKIYVALDTNKTHRWSGSAYVEISASPGSTDVVSEGATNKYFTTARVLAATLAGLSITNAAAVATDTILVAIGKLQGALNFLSSSLSSKADLDSPAFTGNPTAPTQAAANNSTRLATTAFVHTVAETAAADETWTQVFVDDGFDVSANAAASGTHYVCRSGTTLTLPTIFLVAGKTKFRISIMPPAGISDGLDVTVNGHIYWQDYSNNQYIGGMAASSAAVGNFVEVLYLGTWDVGSGGESDIQDNWIVTRIAGYWNSPRQ